MPQQGPADNSVTDAAVIAATYETYRHVPSRKVVQIVLEVPAEGQEALFATIGYPKSNESVWVAVCLLREPGAEPASVPVDAAPEPDMLPPPKPRKSLAQIAGILCSSGAFQKWCGSKSADEAAEWLRGHCNITSRSQLDTNEDAAVAFREIRGEFDAWMAAPDAYSPREEKAA